MKIRTQTPYEWSDEYTNCYNCGKFVRTKFDCWNWRPSSTICNNDTNCIKCEIDEDEDEDED
jgi:hypothetical protein